MTNKLTYRFMDTNNQYDRMCINLDHAYERFLQRYPQEDINFESLITKVIDNAIEVIIEEHNDEEGSYGIHSKSTGIGLILVWRKLDFSNVLKNNADTNNGKNQGVIKTILPIRNYHHYDANDVKIIVESQIEQLGRDIANKKNCIIESKKNKVNHIADKEEDFTVIFWEGKLYDYDYVSKFILVD